MQCSILRSPAKAAFRIEAGYWSILKLFTSALIAHSRWGALGVKAPKSHPISALSAPHMSAPRLT